jgi:hypothetical protein
MSFDSCNVCGADDRWPVATALTGMHAHGRICQNCAERAQATGDVVKWDDPWDNPHHEVNQPFEAHR